MHLIINKRNKALALFCILAQCYTCSLIEASNNNEWIVETVTSNNSSTPTNTSCSLSFQNNDKEQPNKEDLRDKLVNTIEEKFRHQPYVEAFRISYKKVSEKSIIFFINNANKLTLYDNAEVPKVFSTYNGQLKTEKIKIDNMQSQGSINMDNFANQGDDLIIFLGKNKLRASYDSENESIQLEDDIEPKKIKKQAPNSSPTEKKFFANYWRYILSLIMIALTAGAGYYLFFYERKGSKFFF